MKRFLLVLLTFIGIQLNSFGTEQEFIVNENFVIYSPTNASWTTGGIVEDGIVLTKKVQYGNGAYSQYFYHDNKLAFTLTSDCEFIKNGTLVSVNNNELKYTKIIKSENGFEETLLSEEEIQSIFPDCEIIKMSKFQNNKYFLRKKLFAKKNILLLNDTKKFFYNPICLNTKAQNSEIKGLITIHRYGKYHFKHFGARNGKFTIYTKL